jgi:hypothetical protein
MFSQPQRLRRFAVHVLLVWLFALGTAIANACTVQLHLQLPAQAVLQDHQHEAVADENQASDTSSPQHQPCHDTAGHAPPPCERLCDGPSVVPQAERHAVDLPSGFWLASAPPPLSFEFQSFDAEPTVPSDSVRWREPVPIAIAFLRLAL